MTEDIYAFAPERGEEGTGTVKVANEHGVYFTLSAEGARKLATELESCASYAESLL